MLSLVDPVGTSAEDMNRKNDSFLCFAHGGRDGWEAICIDLDIAIQADSFEEARAVLVEAIHEYYQAALQEAPAIRGSLLDRRSPFWTTFGLTMKLIAFNIFRGSKREAQASFPVICPA